MKELSNWRMSAPDLNWTSIPTDVNAFYAFQENAISKFKNILGNICNFF